MVKGQRKSFKEIKEMIKGYRKILTVGCGGCVSVCYAGGLKEVGTLTEELAVSFKQEALNVTVSGYTVERQCNMDFLAELDNIVNDYDCLISMACGAGAQYLAERFPLKAVFPAINTMFIGVDREIGIFEEKCRACGDCVLGWTGGICPITRCAKSLLNGPCGGTNKGKCEINETVPCAWYMIHERLSAQNRLDLMKTFREPINWVNQTPRTLVQPIYKGPASGNAGQNK